MFPVIGWSLGLVARSMLMALLLLTPGLLAAQPTLRDLYDWDRHWERQRQDNERHERESREAQREAQERAAERRRLEEQIRVCGNCTERPALVARLKAHEDRDRMAREMFCGTWRTAELGNPALVGLIARWAGIGRMCDPQADQEQARLLAEVNFKRAMTLTDVAEVEDVATALTTGRYGVRDPEKAALLVLRAGGLRGGRDGFELAYAQAMYRGDPIATKDQTQALRLIADLAARYPPAMLAMAGYYCRGPFPPSGRSAADAEKWIVRYAASAQADGQGLYALAQLYRGDDCFDRNATRMRALLQAAAAKGDIQAQRELASTTAAGAANTSAPPPQSHPQAPATSAGVDLARSKNCGLCHATDKKLLGPSYVTVAQRYASQPDAIAQLSNRLLRGGKCLWRSALKSDQQLTEAEVLALAQWIMAMK